MELTPIEALMQNVMFFFSSVFTDWVPDVIDSITEYPILTLFVVCVPLVGIAIGVFNRLVKAN